MRSAPVVASDGSGGSVRGSNGAGCGPRQQQAAEQRKEAGEHAEIDDQCHRVRHEPFAKLTRVHQLAPSAGVDEQGHRQHDDPEAGERKGDDQGDTPRVAPRHRDPLGMERRLRLRVVARGHARRLAELAQDLDHERVGQPVPARAVVQRIENHGLQLASHVVPQVFRQVLADVMEIPINQRVHGSSLLIASEMTFHS